MSSQSDPEAAARRHRIPSPLCTVHSTPRLVKICPQIPAPRLKGLGLQDTPASSSLRLAISQSSPNSSTVHSCEPVDKIGQKDVRISPYIRPVLFSGQTVLPTRKCR